METPLRTLESCYFSMGGIIVAAILLLLFSGLAILCGFMRLPKRVSVLPVLAALCYCGPLSLDYLYPFHVLDEQRCGHQSPGWIPPGIFHHPLRAELDQLGEHKPVIRAWTKPADQPTDSLHDCMY